MLYQLLTGHPPFAGGTTYETIKLLLDTEPRQPRLLNPKIDRDLSTICLKCLEKDPKRRYSSALALAEDLGTLAKARADSGATHWSFRAWKKMGATQSNQRATRGVIVARAVAAAGWIVWKSEFFRHPRNNWNRRSAV